MPKVKMIKRKSKVKQGLRDVNEDRNDGVSKKHMKKGRQSSSERWFSSWLKKGQNSGKKKNEKNPVAANAAMIGKKRQRTGNAASSNGKGKGKSQGKGRGKSDNNGDNKQRRKLTSKERYGDTGDQGRNAASAAKRSQNPMADKRPDESMTDFKLRKAKETRKIVAQEEFSTTKRASKAKRYHKKKELKRKEQLEAKRAKDYDSEEDEWNAAAGASRTRAVAFGERIDDAPRNLSKFKNVSVEIGCWCFFVICYLLFVICYLLFVICYLLFVYCLDLANYLTNN